MGVFCRYWVGGGTMNEPENHTFAPDLLNSPGSAQWVAVFSSNSKSPKPVKSVLHPQKGSTWSGWLKT